MGLIRKVKAAFAAKKVVKQLGQAASKQAGWKTLAFWLTLVGNLVTLATALQGLIPAQAALVAMTVLTAVYNILRGAKKSQEAGVKSLWTGTEFWLGVGTCVSTSFVTLIDGGVNPSWLVSANVVLAAVMKMARDLAKEQPGQLGIV
jgi:hypothetical protein